MSIRVRKERVADHAAIRHVHELAFGQVDEAKLVEALRSGGQARVSLVAESDGRVVGNILFSDLPILTDNSVVSALSLAPMAVLPEYQRQGIGSALVERGIEVCRDDGHRIIVVLGHRHFYPRFGFSAALAQSLVSPFSGHDSWMALELVPGALHGVAGWVRYPPAFGIGVQVRPAVESSHSPHAPPRLSLHAVAGTFAVCKLPSGSPIPSWATAGDVFSVTRTLDELSVVCREEFLPPDAMCERCWGCLRVIGSMPFTLVGVLASLTSAVAQAGIGIFAVSTFDTDYLFIKQADMPRAMAALARRGTESRRESWRLEDYIGRKSRLSTCFPPRPSRSEGRGEAGPAGPAGVRGAS